MVLFRHVSLFFMLAFVPVLFLPVHAVAGPPTADELIALSRQKNLSRDRYWHILMHYGKTLFGFKSQVDDPQFFLAPDGKTNPRAELEATIAALFQPDDEAAHPFVCRFYARFAWLRETLGADTESYAHRACEEIDRIEPVSATLVFPTYYMNNPASMFGHTLLAIQTDYENKRLAYAVNYAARADNVNGLSFAVSGIFGLYKGYYSVEPYYKKIQEYGDIHQRDIWEYPLNLTPEELRRLIRHVKEFDKGVYTDYFFFDENCSYNLLYLLEAARPSVNLVSRFRGPAVLPVDTIRAMAEEGLLAEPAFRPSKATRIKQAIDALDGPAVATALDVIDGRAAPADAGQDDPARQAAILDLAAEQLQYLYVKKEIDKPTYQQRFLGTLSARSRLGVMSPETRETVPAPPRPETGHASNRFSLAAGKRDGEGFAELRFRPAFTDLLDMDYIHNQGAQIEFGDARLRYSLSGHSFRLQQLDIIDIISISGRDAFFKPLSWKVDTGFHRKTMENGQASLYYRLNTGTGVAFDLPVTGLVYAMVDGEVDLSGALNESYALGPGLALGMVKTVAPFWKAHLRGGVKWFVAGDDHVERTVGFSNNFRVSKNHQVSVEVECERVRHETDTEVSGVWHIFF
ncbi:MAG: DUF4105 domain-containing protein [Thermodesulfobacteriota bacterium]